MMGFEGFSECELSIHSRLASIAGGQNVMKGEVWRGCIVLHTESVIANGHF